jgi:iron-sulfur cluster repair protein YtfE (RIC family)
MKQMDPLIRLVNDHEKISEFLEEVVETRGFFHEEEEWRKINPIEEYFQRHIIHHFEFEEKKVFPAILLKLATLESIKLILELQKEHGVILTKLREFRSITSKKNTPVDKETGSQLNFVGRKIIHLLLTHASKEDDKLLPILEKNREIFDF